MEFSGSRFALPFAAPHTSFFIRHTTTLGVTDSLVRELADDNRIFVHFPHPPKGNRSKDLETADPQAHEPRGRRVLERMVKLVAEGALVCAEFHHRPAEALIGVVPPASSIELRFGEWGTRYPSEQGRLAIVKSVKLERARWLPPGEYLALSAGRPRQGTLIQWRKAHQRLTELVYGRTSVVGLSHLPPDLQEVMCAEALRIPDIAARVGIKPIKHLVFPIGRTRRDLDIDAVDCDGGRLLMQVTYHEWKDVAWKAAKLRRYAAPGVTLVMICRVDQPRLENGITVVPLERLFELFSKTSFFETWRSAAV